MMLSMSRRTLLFIVESLSNRPAGQPLFVSAACVL